MFKFKTKKRKQQFRSSQIRKKKKNEEKPLFMSKLPILIGDWPNNMYHF